MKLLLYANISHRHTPVVLLSFAHNSSYVISPVWVRHDQGKSSVKGVVSLKGGGLKILRGFTDFM